MRQRKANDLKLMDKIIAVIIEGMKNRRLHLSSEEQMKYRSRILKQSIINENTNKLVIQAQSLFISFYKSLGNAVPRANHFF